MDLNKKNYIDNDNSKPEEEYIYTIDSKNILEINKKKNFGEKFGKSCGSILLDTSEEDLINQSTNSSITSSAGNVNLDSNAQKLMNIFTEKMFPKCNLDSFLISKKLSSQYFKKIEINKNKIEECINFIYSNKQKFVYTGIINFDLKTIKNLGYILMMSYYKFGDFKINDRKALKSNIRKILKDSTDVIQDFFNFCNKKKIIPDHHKKTSYWEKHSQNYYLPAIFIFLLNSLDKVEIININFGEINDIITNEDVDFFSIVIYNIQHIFSNVNNIKINLIHKKLQCILFSKYFEELQKNLILNNVNIKKIFFKLDYVYDKKWNFENEFLLNEYRNLHKKKFLENSNDMNNTKSNEFNLNNFRNETKNNIKSTGRSKFSGFFHDIKTNLQQRFSVQPGEGNILQLHQTNSINKEDEIEINEEKEQFANNNPNIIYKNVIDYDNNFNILKSILLSLNAINHVNNLCKLDLILNDSYSIEFNDFFEYNVFDQENKSVNLPLLKDFHLIDIISNKFFKLSTMNLEINSLDSITFKKLLESILINTSIMSLNISLFSSDVTYFQQSLYKLYYLNLNESLNGINMNEEVDTIILQQLLNDFCNNLKILFNIVRYKNIQILGFNLDIPKIIENNQRFTMAIIKFILNLLLYVTRKNAIIQKFTLLAPKLKLNNDFYPFINNVLGTIKTNDNNKIIKELSFQAHLYKIINLKNIIGESLVILNIGDCDLITFKELVHFITSFKFCTRSSLSQLSISLIKSQRTLTKDLYKILFKIFNVKIKKLKELNIYSNIILNYIKEYIYLLKIFNNNWISSCTLTLNSKSEEIYKLKECQEEKNKIKYLVPDCLENELLWPDDIVLRKKIDKDKIVTKNDEAFWLLKYIFQIRYRCVDFDEKNKDESLSKILTNNILSYIHFQKKVKINHNIKEKDSNE